MYRPNKQKYFTLFFSFLKKAPCFKMLNITIVLSSRSYVPWQIFVVLLVIQLLSILHISIWIWLKFDTSVFATYFYSTIGGTFYFIPSFLNDSRFHDLFNASWHISLPFSPMIIWSLKAVSSAVHWGKSQLNCSVLLPMLHNYKML